MPTLLHLNGPPAIGKSTLAALWVQRHPGALNIDIDTLQHLVGGWADPQTHAHELLRPVALAMAAAHLRGGNDVIVPQYLAREDEIDAFECVAVEQGATFREVILLADRAESIERFDLRGATSEWDEHNRRVVAAQGGTSLLASMYDRLVELAQRRTTARIVQSRFGEIEATYASVEQAVAAVD